MGGKNWLKLINNNLVLIVCVPLIIGMHWGWMKLQQIPEVTEHNLEHERRIIGAIKSMPTKFSANAGANEK